MKGFLKGGLYRNSLDVPADRKLNTLFSVVKVLTHTTVFWSIQKTYMIDAGADSLAPAASYLSQLKSVNLAII